MRIASTPNNKRQRKQDHKRTSRTHSTRHALDVQQRTPYGRGSNLRKPIQETIQGFGARVKVRTVHGVELVRVEPIRGKEHGEEEEDKGLEFECLVKTQEFALPGWVLHEDDTGSVLADNVVGIAKC